MTDDTSDADTGGGSHWLRWMVLIALAVGAIVAGRRFALNSSDREFEERLRAADDRRD